MIWWLLLLKVTHMQHLIVFLICITLCSNFLILGDLESVLIFVTYNDNAKCSAYRNVPLVLRILTSLLLLPHIEVE